MLKEVWILSLYNKEDYVESFNENHEKILKLTGNWKDKKEDIFEAILHS